MKKGAVILGSLIAISAGCTGLWAQQRDESVPECLAAALDVHALPPARAAGTTGHLLVMELQNIGTSACMLLGPSVELLPSAAPDYGLPLGAYRDATPEHIDAGPRMLQPGDWAHLLFAWVSRAAPERTCDEYSALKLRLETSNQYRPVDDHATVEVRNLRIRSCLLVSVSGFREGRYTPQSKPAQEWWDWAKRETRELSFPAQPTSAVILPESPSLSLYAPVERTMLGDPLQLRLRFPRDADGACPYRLLRRRDSSGATVISIQNCEPVDGKAEDPVPSYLEAGVARLAIEKLNLAAERPGRVRYDVTASVGELGSGAFANASIELAARDPSPPAQAQVWNAAPDCTHSQLRMEAAEPTAWGERRTLGAYQATNISDHACVVAGVAQVRFIDEQGHEERFLPMACPNCDNEIYESRPNGRIELKPGGTAHFLVGTTGFDSHEDPWMHCQRASSLEVIAQGSGKPVVLPFSGGVCAAIDISAWRAGAFDHDPQNVEWGKAHHAVLEDPAASAPPDCNKPDLLAMGRPSMMPSNGAVAWGLSVASHRFVKGEPVPLHLWIDNRGDREAAVWTCMELDFFKDRGFELYDAYGHRVLRRREVEQREEVCKNPRVARLGGWECTRNFQIPIPAHTCVNGDNYDFTAQLAQQYDLPPGEYTVHVTEEKAPSAENICDEHHEATFTITPGKDITFQVVQP